jgi:hypothetical protein
MLLLGPRTALHSTHTLYYFTPRIEMLKPFQQLSSKRKATSMAAACFLPHAPHPPSMPTQQLNQHATPVLLPAQHSLAAKLLDCPKPLLHAHQCLQHAKQRSRSAHCFLHNASSRTPSRSTSQCKHGPRSAHPAKPASQHDRLPSIQPNMHTVLTSTTSTVAQRSTLPHLYYKGTPSPPKTWCRPADLAMHFLSNRT